MTVRILSYNILAGGEERLPQLARVIQHQRPDAVALLEARSRAHAEGACTAAKDGADLR